MHEMGIANSILEGVAKELQRRPGSRAVKVGVRIGELAGIDPDALSFAFEALTLDTEFAGLAIDIEYVAPRSRCRECSGEFEVRNYELLCPACGSLSTERISGDELEFKYLEIEEPEAAETGRAEPQLADSEARELEVGKK
jgi:hydrogenase nickel incorporation protein HypA/HybF